MSYVTGMILLLCVYPFVLFMYFLLKNEGVPKRGIYYGVSLTKENAQDPEIERITGEYNRQMRQTLLLLLLLPLPALLIPWFSLFLLFWMVWLIAGIFAFFIPFGRANVRLKALKAERGWKQAYREKTDAFVPDDEDNWLWGMIYYNPRDKHVLVDKHIGMGTTMNMATPAGKAVGVFCGLMLLYLLMICIWCMLLEFVPIQLAVTDGRLVASQIGQDYTVPVCIVEEVELLEELPKLSKVNGTGMDTLKKGTYRIPEVGRCQVFLNPQNQVFIRFEAAGTTYYMSGYDDAETLEVYEALKKEQE